MGKKEIKAGAVVMLGVIAAGFLMAHFASAPVIGTARTGYTG